MPINRPYQQTSVSVNNPSLPRLTGDDDEMAVGSLPGLVLWLDPRRCVEEPNNLFIWKDSVNSLEFSSTGSSTVEGAINFSSANNRKIITVNGNAFFRQTAENPFRMPTNAFTALMVVNSTEVDTTVLIGSPIDPVAASPLTFQWGIASTNRLLLAGQSVTGTPSTRAASADTVYQGVRRVVAVTFSVERGTHFFRDKAATNVGLQTASQGLDRTPLGPDTGDTLKLQLFAEGSSAPSRLIGDAGDIIILDRDYSAPRYLDLLKATMNTIGGWYGVA